MNDDAGFVSALSDFRQARRKAKLQALLNDISGKSGELMSYQEVKRHINLSGLHRSYSANIPLDAIVGSVGRYQDFNDQFLPLIENDAQRWAKVKLAQEKSGLPPIEVYKVSDVYFVLDGHHRVSVARAMGSPTVDANVHEFRTNIHISPNDDLDDVILKAEKADMLEVTGLDHCYPDYDFSVTLPGRYREVYDHIRVHQYFLGLEKKRDIPLKEAVESWMKTVYLPAIQAIRVSGILRDFPGRKETDLYLWLKKHQAELAESLGWKVDVHRTADALTKHSSTASVHTNLDMDGFKFDFSAPVESGLAAPNGKGWLQTDNGQQSERLFKSILVCLSGKKYNWEVLEQAVHIARKEGAVLRGLHVAANEKEKASHKTDKIRERFYARCEEEHIKGEFAVEVGKVAHQIVRRAVWVDLVILHLIHPPGPAPLARLKSGITEIIQRCPRPVMTVPSAARMDVALLAYDGSPKADQALFLSSYLGVKWRLRLVVVCSDGSKNPTKENLDHARTYLEKNGVKAEYELAQGAAENAILTTAARHHANLIVMGGYGAVPLVHTALGSTVDHILRRSSYPVLICR